MQICWEEVVKHDGRGNLAVGIAADFTEATGMSRADKPARTANAVGKQPS